MINPLYTRHFALTEFGHTEQALLREATVMIIGCGGLGHLVATYLTTAGIGHIVLNDFDQIDVSNLQRQFLYSNEDVKHNKAVIAQKKLSVLNPDICIEVITDRLSVRALTDSFSSMDLVIDCSDNFATRFNVNRAAVSNNLPLVSGAAIRFEGQISSFIPTPEKNTPCYQCLFQESDEIAEDCVGNGIFAPVTGVIASAMSVEALKILIHIGTPLVGRLQLYNALDSQWRTIEYSKDPACEVCGRTA